MNKTWAILLWFLGEAILVFAFWYFGQNVKQSHLLINLIVSSTILTVFLVSIFRDSSVLAKRGVGSGMKWFFTLTYTLLSILAMIYFDFFNPVDLLTQGIVQLIFLGVLAMGMWGAFKPAKKTTMDNKYSKMEHRQLMMIRNVVSVARTRAERRADIPSSLLHGIIELQEEVQNISPGNEYVSLKMEGRIMMDMNQLITCLHTQPLDVKLMQYTIKHCMKLINEHQNTYSTHHAHQLT